MKKIILIILLILSSKIFPQSGWITAPGPTGYISNNLYVNIDFVNENTGYLNRDRMYKSTNGGLNWFAITTTIGDYTKLRFFNSGTGYLILSNSTQFAKTTNGGVNWSAMNFGNIYLNDMKFINESTGFVTYTENQYSDTVKGYVSKTTDAGISWDKYLVRSGFSISYLDFCNAQTGYVWGDWKFSKTTNGGVNWTEVNGENINVLLFKFRFTSENTGWAITDTFRIAKTTNGGINWIRQYQLGKTWDFFFLNQNTGWYCYNKIYKTTNAGETWSTIRDSIGMYYKINFINENTGWCYTSTNKILITHNGGNVFVSNDDETPTNFSLSQNYPNPFNPKTKIKFSLVKKDLVNLDVFDITGKTVSTIVNGELGAGTYSFNFSGKDLPGGVYFYRLESGNHSDVKRMVLVK